MRPWTSPVDATPATGPETRPVRPPGLPTYARADGPSSSSLYRLPSPVRPIKDLLPLRLYCAASAARNQPPATLLLLIPVVIIEISRLHVHAIDWWKFQLVASRAIYCKYPLTWFWIRRSSRLRISFSWDSKSVWNFAHLRLTELNSQKLLINPSIIYIIWHH